jgi:hypothetical protein
MPTSGTPDPKIEAYNTLGLLKQFLKGILRWGIASGTNLGAPSIISVNADGKSHPVDLNATYLVSSLNIKNRSGNSGTLYVGSDPGSGSTLPGIQLLPGTWTTPGWTTPSRWYYNAQGAASTDVYEIWWSS